MFSKKQIHRFFLRTFSPIEKRIRFVGGSILMTSLMLFTTFFDFDLFWLFVPILLLISYFITYLSILEDLKKFEWITLFLMPVLFTVSFYLFYFLFPVRWITRLPFMLMFGFSFYAILLTSNIFNVGVGKSLQLYRAAFSVNYFFQTLILFLLLNVMFSFKQGFLVNGIFVFLIILPMAIQLFWSVKLKEQFDVTLFHLGLFLALIITQLTMVMSFVPVTATIMALFLTASYYSLTGLIYHYIDHKLFMQTIREYLFVMGFVSFIVLLTIPW